MTRVMDGLRAPSISAQEVQRDRHTTCVTAVAHHQEPARQSLFQAVCTVAGAGNQDLLEESLHVADHEVVE
jgi:hypothetical protein